MEETRRLRLWKYWKWEKLPCWDKHSDSEEMSQLEPLMSTENCCDKLRHGTNKSRKKKSKCCSLEEEQGPVMAKLDGLIPDV